jgi:hypothetical protein
MLTVEPGESKKPLLVYPGDGSWWGRWAPPDVVITNTGTEPFDLSRVTVHGIEFYVVGEKPEPATGEP